MERSDGWETVTVIDSKRLKAMATQLCTFMFGRSETPLYMSNHYVKEHFEPTDGEAIQPILPFEEAGL